MKNFLKKSDKQVRWGIYSLIVMFLFFQIHLLAKWNVFPFSQIYKNKITYHLNMWMYKMDFSQENYTFLQEGYLWGTDIFGRSLYFLVAEGFYYSLSVGIIVVLGLMISSLVLAKLTMPSRNDMGHYFFDYIQSFVSWILNLLSDTLFIFPTILLGIVVMSLFDKSFFALILVLIISGTPGLTTLAKQEMIQIYSLPFIEAERAMGSSEWSVFFKHVVPSIMPVMSVHYTLAFSGAILAEATLGFLGLASSPYSWGVIMNMGKNNILESSHQSLLMMLILFWLIGSLSLIGDGLAKMKKS